MNKEVIGKLKKNYQTDLEDLGDEGLSEAIIKKIIGVCDLD